MKIIILAIVLIINTVNIDANGLVSRDCRDWETWMHTPSHQMIRLPHVSDCTGFYECENGKMFVKHCTHPLHYNPYSKTCDWAHSIGCIKFVDYSREMEKEVGWQPWMNHRSQYRH